MQAISIDVTCPDEATAREISDALIGRRLAACCRIGPPVESRYWWKGAIERADEVPLAIKTRADLFDAVAEAIRQLHPYETPAILATPLRADEATLRWIADACIASP